MASPAGKRSVPRCPASGKSLSNNRKLCQGPGSKTFLFCFSEMCDFLCGSCSDEGRFAIVTKCGCRMRWTLWSRLTSAAQGGRRNRVVLISRRWDQALW
jgi:hypothetical protein